MEQNQNTPKIVLGQYKGLAVTRHVRPVKEQTVEQELVHQTRTHAFYRPSSEPAKRGSRVLLDFEGFLNGQPIPDSKMEKVMVCLGDGKLMPEAETAICGHCAGEVFRFDFTYPTDFRVPELSGKTAQFEIRLHTVAEKQTPELNEEFAKTLGYASLDAMRAAVRKAKAASHEANADRKAQIELLDMAGANATVELPAARIEQTAAQEMKQLRLRLSRSGIDFDAYCQKEHTTPEALEANFRHDAERKMRSILAAQAIAEAEQIAVRPEEVNAEYLRLAQLHDTPIEEIRKVLSAEGVAAAIAARKVQEFLLANAKVTTVMDGADKE